MKVFHLRGRDWTGVVFLGLAVGFLAMLFVIELLNHGFGEAGLRWVLDAFPKIVLGAFATVLLAWVVALCWPRRLRRR